MSTILLVMCGGQVMAEAFFQIWIVIWIVTQMCQVFVQQVGKLCFVHLIGVPLVQMFLHVWYLHFFSNFAFSKMNAFS